MLDNIFSRDKKSSGFGLAVITLPLPLIASFTMTPRTLLSGIAALTAAALIVAIMDDADAGNAARNFSRALLAYSVMAVSALATILSCFLAFGMPNAAVPGGFLRLVQHIRAYGGLINFSVVALYTLDVIWCRLALAPQPD